MAKLKDNTIVNDENGQPRSLLAGVEVPAWAKDQIGDHLLEGGDDAEPTAYRGQKLADLKAEIVRRNEGRDEDAKINPEGRASIESYAAALEADDKAQAEADESAGDGGDGGSGS